jgi:V/A-type H+-transporting ATPase subunit I
VGNAPEKHSVLESLQDLGCLHIIPLAEQGGFAESGASASAHEALKFLLSSRHKFPQVTSDKHFDAQNVEHQALELRNRIDALTAERDELLTHIAERRPWGDFKPPTPEELRGQRLWFYRVPAHQRQQVENSALHWHLVGHDDHFDYVAVLSEQEPPPDAMPVPPLSPDPRSLGELEDRLEEVELELEDAQVARESLTRWSMLLARSMNRLDDQAALQHVGAQTRDLESVFALQAWIPVERLPELQSFAEKRELVLEAVTPEESETPPTQFHNPEPIAGGEQLVSFYMTPSYWLWDPSPVVFFSFALFFAMIMCDAGYGFVMGLFTAAVWKRMGGSTAARRWRSLLVWMSGITLIYGVLAGSYFGFAPHLPLLKKLQILDMKNYSQMMLLSALIGAAHLTLANLVNAWRYGRNPKFLAPLGWAAIVMGGAALLLNLQLHSATARHVGEAGLVIGALLVVLFTAADQPIAKRLLGGVLGLTKLSAAFGDVLSYLRLFALGLASASLATVFNNMADNLHRKFAGLGLLFAILLMLIGHAVNLGMSVASGFIHGLRLNVIEFFNWGVQEEGKVYRPFARKEAVPWKR